MSSNVNRQFRLKSRPVGKIKTSDFDLVEEPVPTPGPGEAVIRNLYLSLDPTNRIWMSDMDQYMPPVEIGAVMRGGGIGKVVASNSDAYKVGDTVSGLLGWQDYYVAGPNDEIPVGVLPPELPVGLPTMLGACGLTGLTAYFGLLNCATPKAGETILVSAAAGSVGTLVGQIAKAAVPDCTVIGIAGTDEKCQWLKDELGFDATVNYKTEPVFKALKAVAPQGIDVYFDNVGGDILEAALFRMNNFGRIACCGAVSQYDGAPPSAGPRGVPGLIVTKRLNLRGFIMSDFPNEREKALKDLEGWVAEGKIKVQEDIIDGLENTPAALIGLLAGENRGKRMVKVI